MLEGGGGVSYRARPRHASIRTQIGQPARAGRDRLPRRAPFGIFQAVLLTNVAEPCDPIG